jgi:hypothetical protein
MASPAAHETLCQRLPAPAIARASNCYNRRNPDRDVTPATLGAAVRFLTARLAAAG